MLPSPRLAELRGLQHSAVCWQLSPVTLKPVEKGWPRALWAALGTLTPQEGAEPGNASSKKGQGAELKQRESPALILLPENWKRSCGCLLPKGVRPCCCPCLSLSTTVTLLPTTSSQLTCLGLQYGQSKQFCYQQPPT